MRVNMAKIGQVAGVSASTVCNALNNRPGVNAETAAHIFRIAHDMGYFSKKKLSTIRLLHLKRRHFNVRETPFFAGLLQSIERECQAQELNLLFSSVNPDEGWEQADSFLGNTSCGLILLATEATNADIAHFDDVRRPFLLLDNCPRSPAHSVISIDNETGAMQAVEYLIQNGHHKIGYLCYADRFRNFLDREAGFKRALEEAGLEPDPQYIVSAALQFDTDWQSLRKSLITMNKLPTAFFADNDILALNAVRALRSLGVRVPKDVSVVGFDDIFLSELFTPSLTTINVNTQELARLAVQSLLDQAQSGIHTPTKMQLCTRLVERESVHDLTAKNFECGKE